MPMIMREGLTGRPRPTGAAVQPAAAPVAVGSAHGAARYGRRLLPRIAVVLCVGLVLPGWPPRGELLPVAPEGPTVFVPAASAISMHGARLRGASQVPRKAEESEDDSEALRQKVAALQQKLAAQEAATQAAQAAAPPAAVPPAALPVNPAVQAAYDAVLAALPELEKVDDARLGMVAEKQYVFQEGDASRDNPIYKRKYEVLGMTLNQQEAYMKAFKRCVKVAKESKEVEAMIKLVKEGGAGLDKREVKTEVDKLARDSRLARTFFRDVVPEVLEDPIKDAVGGLLATFGLIALSLCLCFIFFPPIPPDVE